MNNSEKQTDGMDKENVHITLLGRGTPIYLECGKGEKLLEAMLRQEIQISADCGGRGTCGKCRIRLISGELGITPSDRAILSEEELQKGYRLSCKAHPISDCTIELCPGDASEFKIISDFIGMTEQTGQSGSLTGRAEEYAIAVDIGTTTIAVSVLEPDQNKVCYTHTLANRQRAFGADVISRIQASNSGRKEELRTCIQKDLLEGIQMVVRKAGISKNRLQRIAVACNTTMRHLLLGYSCETLGSYPFQPVNVRMVTLPFEEVFATKELEAAVTLLPGLSAFIGGDIIAGLMACDFDKLLKPCLFLDLGTNGEMAVGCRDGLLLASTAAGPAFEGGNIACGVGSIAGAVSGVDIAADRLQYKTIDNKAPIGICGTGVIELTCELREAGLLDETGLLTERYFDNGYPVAPTTSGSWITFTQKDIREFQLAKAAVRTGMEILVRRYGIRLDDVDTVYLAGGFGYQLNLDKAFRIGLLPKEFQGRVKAVGNSALGGAADYLTDQSASERLEQLIRISEEIHLSNDEEFNDLFIRYINLDE